MPIRIGTRGSALAFHQAEIVKHLLADAYPDLSIEIIPIKTSGDKIKGELKPFGGKGLFVKEIEEALLKDQIDLAVHSMKDVPTNIPDGLVIAVVCKRADPRDVFISDKYPSLDTLPKGPVVGTSSPRRISQTLAVRPDVRCVGMRGNVPTRLRKLSRGECDALILAAAGFIRLGLESRITSYLDINQFLPAIGQGAIGIEMLEGTGDLVGLVKAACNDEVSYAAVTAEREFLKTIGGDCHSPIAAYGEVRGDKLLLTGWVGSPDGRRTVRDAHEGSIESPEAVGRELGERFVKEGAREVTRLR